MFSSTTVIAAFFAYMVLLFFLAMWVERRSLIGRNPANNPIVYSLSLAVYCTSWTFYGSVGNAATNGMLFLTIYLGPTLVMVLAGLFLRKLIRLKSAHRITSIADFISARYDSSQSLAAIATFIALIGIAPYIALQFKAVSWTMSIITVHDGPFSSWLSRQVGPLLVIMMALFTNIFGVRRLDPTERHSGMVMAVAAESLVKLTAFLAAGLFVTYSFYGGFGDMFQRLSELPHQGLFNYGSDGGASYITWTTYIVLAMAAILFLPRQFHVAVVENFNEKHIRTSRWLFPLYMLLINIFVFPIAMAGLLQGKSAQLADAFVLLLPLEAGHQWLSLLVFIGGFSAATSMIMISCMTMSTMITNHLLLPLVNWFPRLAFLRRRLLQCRWLAVTLVVILGYWFETVLGESYALVNMGIISFAAVLQFAPAIIGGIFWERGNKRGAQMGLCAGFLVWFYTLLLPAFVHSGWVEPSLLNQGPWGIEFLKPEELMGLSGLDPLSHAVFWSLLCNVGFYMLGSLYWAPAESELRVANSFVYIDAGETLSVFAAKAKPHVYLPEKKRRFLNLMQFFFNSESAELILNRALEQVDLAHKQIITVVELAELYSEMEKSLAGVVGAATSHQALEGAAIFSPEEARELSAIYGHVLARLNVSPQELKKRIDYHQEREALLTRHAEELQEKIIQLQEEIALRNRAELALRESQEKYQLLIDHAYEGIAVFQDGMVRFANPRTLAIWGYSDEEMMRISMNDLVHPADSQMVIQRHFLRQKGEPAPREYPFRIVTKDKELKWVQVSAVGIEWNGRPASLAFFTDITARRTAEEERQKTETRFQTMSENVKDLIWTMDLELNFTYVSPAINALTGYTPSEFAGMPLEKTLTPESVARARQALVEQMSQEAAGGADPNRSLVLEIDHIHKDGSIVPTEVRVSFLRDPEGLAIGVLGVSRDITERKQAEETLRLSEERYRSLVENTLDGFAIWELPSGRFLFANPRLLEMLGYSASEIFDIKGEDLFHPDDKRIMQVRTDKRMKGQKVTPALWTYRLLRKDGSELKAEISESLVTFEGKTALQGVIRDVTEQENLRSQLLHAQKMEAIGTMAGGIAHDFNNLLQVLQGYAQLLRMKQEASPKFDKELRGIESAVTRASELTRRLLTFSRKVESELEAVDLNHIIKEFIKLLRRTIPKMIDIELHLAEDIDIVNADPVQIEQVLMNLAVNAVDAMPDGGKLIFETQNVTLDEDYCRTHVGPKPGNYVLLSVTDTGEGIDKENLHHIFEPFFTTKPKGKGTGLGLATVYGIVRSHEGHLMCYSEKGQGATFKIYLPSLDLAPEAANAIITQAKIRGGVETVLLVDDEPQILDIAQESLRQFGYTTLTAGSGEEALEIYKKRQKEIDLVVLDLGMPGMGGLHCLQELMKLDPKAKVVIASGYTAVGVPKTALKQGATGFINKPYGLRDLLEKVRSALDV
jgi:PAS domain S-box-containing protein